MMAVTFYEYAALCSVIYTNSHTTPPSGWRCVLDSGEKPSGFRGEAWTNAPEGTTDTSGYDVVIVVRGTVNFMGVVNDIELDEGLVPSEYYDLKAFYTEVQWYHPHAHLSITGHSLGGGLIQLLNAEFPQHQIHTVTFEAPGMSQVVSHMGWTTTYTSLDTVNYWRYSDVVAWCGGGHLGTNILLSPNRSYDRGHATVIDIVKHEHSIDEIAKEIQEGKLSNR